MHRILMLAALGLVGPAAGANAGERIFSDGFEPCCTLGGEVTGLTGNGLVLQLTAGAISETKPINASGSQLVPYTFANAVPTGTGYEVTIATQPTDQTCTLSNASGNVGSSHVLDINVICPVDQGELIWGQGSWDEADWQ